MASSARLPMPDKGIMFYLILLPNSITSAGTEAKKHSVRRMAERPAGHIANAMLCVRFLSTD